MVYLMIILAAVLILGPVFWLRPSKGEQAKGLLRQAAIKDGASIQPVLLRKDPVYSAVLERNPHLDNYSWMRYQWVAREGESGPDVFETWVQRKDKNRGLVWEPRTITTREPEAVTRMLAPWREQQDVRFLALELGPRNVSVVWTEKTNQEEVKALAARIRELFFQSRS